MFSVKHLALQNSVLYILFGSTVPSLGVSVRSVTVNVYGEEDHSDVVESP